MHLVARGRRQGVELRLGGAHGVASLSALRMDRRHEAVPLAHLRLQLG